jgi:hypothetical protein
VLDALYYEYWCEHKKTNEKEVLVEILARVLGEEDSAKGMWLPGCDDESSWVGEGLTSQSQ